MPARALAPLLALAAAAAPAPPRAAQAEVQGAAAPAGGWVAPGGSLAGNGASRTRPLRGPVRVAWTRELGGAIEGEPLVWDERVLVAVEHPGKERRLHSLDLVDGSSTGRPYTVRSGLPLVPGLWRDLVVARTDGDRFTALRWKVDRLDPVWSHRVGASIGPPAVFEGEILVGSAESLQRLDRGRREPRWSIAGDFRGRPALFDGRVYALVDGEAGTHVAVIDHESGRELGRFLVGDLPGGRDGAAVCVFDEMIFVHGSEPFRPALVGVGSVAGLALPRPLPSGRTVELFAAATQFQRRPAAWKKGWLAFVDDAGADVLLLNPDARAPDVLVLANAANHADFLAPSSAPPTIAGVAGVAGVASGTASGVAYVAGNAVELESGRILWKSGLVPSRAMVPARDTVLVVEGGSRLVALRPEAPPMDAPFRALGALETGERRFEGRAALVDGSVAHGSLELLAGELVQRGRGEPGAPLALREVLCIEREEATLEYAAGAEALVRGVEALVADALARAFVDLAHDARPARDPELLAALVAEAVGLGATDADLAKVAREIDALAARRPRPDADAVRAAEERAAELRGMRGDLFWRRACMLPRGTPLGMRLALLDRTLQESPGHAGALAAVRERLPEELRGSASSDPRDWIQFVAAAAETPLRIVTMPASAQAAPEAERDAARARLARAGKDWRADLTGFESQHLLVVTPLSRPGAIARCLSLGELVCQTLGSIFAAEGAARGAGAKLLLYLYESREEYLAKSGEAHAEAGAGFEWTAGHYDLAANVSRIYLPDDEDALESVLRTFAHELTHHWLRVQCPLFDFEQAGDLPLDQPGYWIAEGFASFVEEFRFDPARRTWDAFNPQSERLDVVANARAEQLLAWKLVLGASAQQFAELAPAGTTHVPTSWYVGRVKQLGARHLFYHQAAAVVQYLYHAREGEKRAALLEYLAAFYTGEREALDVEAAFGMDAESLGRAVQEYARGVASGTGMGMGRK